MDIFEGDLVRLMYQERLLKEAQSQKLRDLFEVQDQPYVEREPGLPSRIMQWLLLLPRREQPVEPRPRAI